MKLAVVGQNAGKLAELRKRFPESCWVKDNYITEEHCDRWDNSVPFIMNYIRKVSRLVGYNLMPYFDKWGYLRQVALRIGDYGTKYYVMTPEMYNEFKADMDAYNAQSYAMLNLDVAMETVGGRQVIIIGSFGDANVAKSYLLRMVKEKTLFEGLKGSNYRNLFGTQRNLNVLMQNDALSIYTKFMQEYYLK